MIDQLLLLYHKYRIVFDFFNQYMRYFTISLLGIHTRNKWDDKVNVKGGKLLMAAIFLAIIFAHFSNLLDSARYKDLVSIVAVFVSYNIPEQMRKWKSRKVRNVYDIFSKGPGSFFNPVKTLKTFEKMSDEDEKNIDQKHSGEEKKPQ